jgi:hypothetical protein
MQLPKNHCQTSHLFIKAYFLFSICGKKKITPVSKNHLIECSYFDTRLSLPSTLAIKKKFHVKFLGKTLNPKLRHFLFSTAPSLHLQL